MTVAVAVAIEEASKQSLIDKAFVGANFVRPRAFNERPYRIK